MCSNIRKILTLKKRFEHQRKLIHKQYFGNEENLATLNNQSCGLLG